MELKCRLMEYIRVYSLFYFLLFGYDICMPMYTNRKSNAYKLRWKMISVLECVNTSVNCTGGYSVLLDAIVCILSILNYYTAILEMKILTFIVCWYFNKFIVYSLKWFNSCIITNLYCWNCFKFQYFLML